MKPGGGWRRRERRTASGAGAGRVPGTSKLERGGVRVRRRAGRGVAGGVPTRCRREADPGRKPGRPSRAGEGAAAGPSRSLPAEDCGAFPGLTRPGPAAPSRVRGGACCVLPLGGRRTRARSARGLCGSRGGRAPHQRHARRGSGPRGRPFAPAAGYEVWSCGHALTFSAASLPAGTPGHPTPMASFSWALAAEGWEQFR